MRILDGNYKHGEYGTPEYISWKHMKVRCNNPNDPDYMHYGGRGITYYIDWEEFDPFLEYMGGKPSLKHELGRIDNNGNYEPGNCQWETRTQQNRNKRTNKLTMSDAREIRMLYNKGYTQYELAEKFNVSRGLISHIIANRIWKEGYLGARSIITAPSK